MFIDQEKNKDIESLEKNENVNSSSFFNSKIILISLSSLIFLLAVSFVVFFVVKNKKPKDIITVDSSQNKTTTLDANGLPVNEGNGNNENENIDNKKAEYLFFGDFYKNNENDFESIIESYELPLNIKIDVANYYDILRKIDLNQYVEDLNQNGFAILNNNFSEVDNFFSAYQVLNEKDIPIFITSDFLIYYYQNILKKVFKEIEGDVFYENLWDISKKLYDISSQRYKSNFTKVGISNDHVLEGQRMEAVFFAVALELLKPKEEQIEKRATLSDKTKFDSNESKKFNFDPPEYLKESVAKEMDLIKNAYPEERSSILFYFKDYSNFNVPSSYQKNAKLNNFYLASKWLNSFFPLYYKSGDCEDCKLDYEDWKISMTASSLIAKDFSDNQDIKNQWAKIYKVLSFFSGLRADLTYLNYNEALISVFGENYNIEDIFSMENEEKEENFKKIQEKIAEFNFLEANGGRDKNNLENKPFLGMRVLTEPYWPNDYIFNNLTYPQVGSYLGNDFKKTINNTFCAIEKNTFYRCQGTGFDVINLIYPIPVDNNYFAENIKYENYDTQLEKIKKHINDFTINGWYNNNYWANLRTSKLFLEYDKNNMPIFVRNKKWAEKDLQTVISSWINLQLNEDQFLLNIGKEGNVLSTSEKEYRYNYVEPNLALIKELISNAEMLLGIFSELKITEKANSIAIDLKDFILNAKKIEIIVKKELKNEYLNEEDGKILYDFSEQFLVNEKGNKVLNFNFKNLKKGITESIEGVKLLLITHKYGEKNIFSIGPIFNYQEK